MPTSQHQSIDALFVGYEDQENLGLRSIMATLQEDGFHVALEPYVPGDPSGVLAAVQKYSPHLVGFSIIFQYTLNEFAALIAALRKAGVQSHFTAGGHLPSLRPREVLEAIPHLDSVVRFEGELTTLELLKKLHEPETWSSIKGLAFRQGSEVVITPPRPLISDLDALPLAKRSRPRSAPPGVHVTSILASRGCFHNCAFCSIRQFYGTPPGPLRRARSPEAVASEIRYLLERDDARFFIFQDDDFAATSKKQRQWVQAFLDALDAQRLTGRVAWRVACRVDDVEEDLFVRCRDHGLIAVYVGVESGNTTGLQTLNKRVTVEQNLMAIHTLKETGLAFELGFMLLDPDSTIETVRENIEFLRQVASDGSCSIPFCKMLPYSGTPIETRLQKEGRLKGTLSRPDYSFLDPRLDWYELFVARVFRFRNFDMLGLVERLRAARAVQLLVRMFSHDPRIDEYEEALRQLTAKANVTALNTLETGLRFIAERDVDSIIRDWSMLGYVADLEHHAENTIQNELDRILETYNPQMLRAYEEEYSRRLTEGQPIRPPSPFS